MAASTSSVTERARRTFSDTGLLGEMDAGESSTLGPAPAMERARNQRGTRAELPHQDRDDASRRDEDGHDLGLRVQRLQHGLVEARQFRFGNVESQPPAARPLFVSEIHASKSDPLAVVTFLDG